jgi:cystathionine beta-lyase
MSHAAMSEAEREKRGIKNSLIRLSVGLENPDDLIKDFSDALKSIQQKELVLQQGESS